MLHRDQIINWTEVLVGYVNGDVKGVSRRDALVSARAEKDLRWLVARRKQVTDVVRRSVSARWLESDREPLLPVSALIDYDDKGRVVVSGAATESFNVLAALTVAEIFATDSPVEIHECALDTCHRLFVHISGRRGHPRKCCCDAHSATLRTRKHRARNRNRRSRRR